MSETPIEVSVVVPVYKEEASIGVFLRRLEPVLDGLAPNYEILFCLDPSPDGTESELMRQIARNSKVRLVVFSRRFGQPAAKMAGILMSTGRSCVAIDVDLQNPPELITDLYRKLQKAMKWFTRNAGRATARQLSSV